MRARVCLLLGAMVAACSHTESPPSANSEARTAAATGAPSSSVRRTSYLERLAHFHTRLVRTGPAPQAFDAAEHLPAGVREIRYPSNGLELKAWVGFPPGAREGAKVPGVVYFHGGFAFGADDFEVARPFLQAGLAVMCPMLRGENGNPGAFELYLGEVRDAQAAVAWLAHQNNIDAKHLYTFGHSAGGVISALLSLQEVPIRHGGSAGGLYGPELFDWMRPQVPFAQDDPEERQLRVLVGNIAWMKHPHFAFVGDGDPKQAVQLAQAEQTPQSPLQIVTVHGNHLTSLPDAVSAYVKVIQERP